jgi:hypothetical protein
MKRLPIVFHTVLAQCEEIGATLAASLSAGIY